MMRVGENWDTERRRPPSGLLACLVIRNSALSPPQMWTPAPFPDALNCLQKKIACYDHFKIPFLFWPLAGQWECGVSRMVPSYFVRIGLAHPPTTPTCLCPWNSQRNHVACILIQKAEARLNLTFFFFLTRCNLTQEIDPTQDFSQRIMVYFCVCQSTERMCTHFQPYNNYTRKWVHWFFFNQHEWRMFVYISL